MEIDIAQQVYYKLLGEVVSFTKELVHLDRTIVKVGWGNGYACIPGWHPCYGLHYDEICDKYGIRVHGGLTFAEYASKLKWPELPLDQLGSWV